MRFYFSKFWPKSWIKIVQINLIPQKCGSPSQESEEKMVHKGTLGWAPWGLMGQ